MRLNPLIGIAAIMLLHSGLPALAGSFGPGNTVQPEYWTGSISGQPEFEDWCDNGGTPTTPATPSMCNSGSTPMGIPAPLTGPNPVQYIQGALSGSTVLMGDTTITITNQLANPFCSVAGTGAGTGIGKMCADAFDGFDFLYTGSVDITGVSVDTANSAADFLPTTQTADNGNTHLGLQLINSQDVRVDLTGDLPAVGDNLVIDLSFAATPPPPSVPEPASLLLLGSALLGLAGVRRIGESRA